MDTTHLYKVVISVLRNINLTYKVMADGKLGLDDIPELFAFGSNLYDIAQGVGEASREFKGLSQVELENLTLFVQDELDLPNDNAELIIESAINTALMFYSVFGKGVKKG